MLFVVDETSWCLGDRAPPKYEEVIERILDCIDDLVAEGHECCYSDDLFNMAVAGDLTFYDLYSDKGPITISREVQNRIGVIFGRLNAWQNLPHAWPPDLDAAIDGKEAIFAPSICWAHAQSCLGPAQTVPCIVDAQERLCGLVEVRVAGANSEVWFVSSQPQTLPYFRWLIVEGTSTPTELVDLFELAFPTLDAVDGCFAGIKGMSKPYAELISAIVSHLAALADHGSQIFNDRWQDVASKFGALGLNVSDENGHTKQNSKARQARTKSFHGTDYVFWWHTKIEPDRDRIHFCPDKVPGGGRIIVGLFCEHLVT